MFWSQKGSFAPAVPVVMGLEHEDPRADAMRADVSSVTAATKSLGSSLKYIVSDVQRKLRSTEGSALAQRCQ